MKLKRFPVESSDFKKDALEGLAKKPRQISPKYFYDLKGSELFDQITKQPEYYPTRTEISIYEDFAEDMSEAIGHEPLSVIELGSGSNKKIRKLIKVLNSIKHYVPVDISEEFLEKNALEIHEEFEDIEVLGVVADYTQDWELHDEIKNSETRKLVYFPGSTIGNLDPEHATALLKHVREIMGEDGYLLIGADLIKNKEVLERAYDDAAGVTAQFNFRILERFKSELGAELNISHFKHQSIFNEELSRIEMRIVAAQHTEIKIGEKSFCFEKGDYIHSESSYKFSDASFNKIAEAAGLKEKKTWKDAKQLFSVRLLESKT